MTPLTNNHARGAGYLAAQLLHQDAIASIDQSALFAKIHFGKNSKARREALDRSITLGWLALDKSGALTIGTPAVAFFTGKPVEVAAHIGQIAAPRDTGSVYERPALSRKYLTNSRGTRADVPAFSVRDGMRFSTLAGGQP